MTALKQCPFYYHTMTNVTPRRCRFEEGHSGNHEEEQLVPFPSQQSMVQSTGWIKH